jgi:transcriptional regulator with XRE-family HTH domain
MAQRRDHATRAIEDELPAILAERKWSLRRLATEAHVSNPHLSRALRGARSKSVSGDLARALAIALDLPDDYFLEFRRSYIDQRVRGNPELCNRVYSMVKGLE